MGARDRLDRARPIVAVLALFVFAFASAAAAPTLEQCDANVLDAPDDPSSYYCFTLSVRAHGLADEAARRLDAILAIRPDRHWARLNLAFIEAMRGSPRADELLHDTVAGAVEAGDLAAEVYARLSISDRLKTRGGHVEAKAELERALRAAKAADSRRLLAWVRQNQALQALEDLDHGKARRFFRAAEELVFPDGDPELQGRVLSGLGNVCWYLGEFDIAMGYFRREAEHWKRIDNAYARASALHNIALLAVRLADLGRIEPEELEALELDALDAAVRTGNRRMEAAVRVLLGEARAGRPAIAELQKALAISREVGEPQNGLLALREIARETFWLGPEHHERAYELVDRAIEEARALGSRFDIARGLILRALFAGYSTPGEQAVAAYHEAFDAVERIRDLQPDEKIRARVFSEWVYPYYRLSGSLLSALPGSTRPNADLDLAFRTIERMRSRVLLDRLDAAGLDTFGASAGPLHAARDAVLARIAAVQSALMDPELEIERRGSRLEELERLEAEEADLRDRLAREDPMFASIRAPTFPSVEEIQSALGEDQALLAYQLPYDRYLEQGDAEAEGGAWVIAMTRDEARAFRLPRRHVLEEQVEVFVGLFRRRDGSDAGASTFLYRELLHEVHRWLPDGITRLTIVPDDVLCRLPFSALRDGVGAPPLAARYEISYVPSATLWLRWQRERDALPRGGTLAIVDPELPAVDPAEKRFADAEWIGGPSLGPLPHARREARTLVRLTGGTMRHGAEASERFLKEADLKHVGILHVAAHAVIDERLPHRSAVVLSPGAPEEDGLMQMREIGDLDLDGGLVILAACRSARGEMLDGEGVLGLARAFHQAGAHAVLGSLWPIRDDEAAALMEAFASRLSEGRSVSAAMAAARRSQIADGVPAETWAGLVVLGDGDLVPVPAGVRHRWRSASTLLILAALAAPTLAFLWWYGRRVDFPTQRWRPRREGAARLHGS
jgi:CHAT domain-containing protein